MEEFKSWREAVVYCRGVLEKFRPKHKRVKIFIGFEVEPAVWHDCPHFTNPEDALNQAKHEDMLERKLKENRRKNAK